MASYPDPTNADEPSLAPAEPDEPRSGILPSLRDEPPSHAELARGGEPRAGSPHAESPREADGLARPSSDRTSSPEGYASRSSVPVARVALARQSSPDERALLRTLTLTVSVGVEPSRAREAYVTISLPSGAVVHEGATDALGCLQVDVLVPADVRELHVLVEDGTKYRNAKVPLGDEEHVTCELR